MYSWFPQNNGACYMILSLGGPDHTIYLHLALDNWLSWFGSLFIGFSLRSRLWHSVGLHHNEKIGLSSCEREAKQKRSSLKYSAIILKQKKSSRRKKA